MKPELKLDTSEDFSQLLNSLEQAPANIAELVEGLSAEQSRFRSSAEEFSIVENVCHLRDIEIEGYTLRINRILAEAKPDLADIDGGRLAVERHYNHQSLDQGLSAFQHARLANVDVLRGLETNQLKREGTLEGLGTVTLQKLVSMMCEHDEGHLADIKILRRRLTAD